MHFLLIQMYFYRINNPYYLLNYMIQICMFRYLIDMFHWNDTYLRKIFRGHNKILDINYDQLYYNLGIKVFQFFFVNI